MRRRRVRRHKRGCSVSEDQSSELLQLKAAKRALKAKILSEIGLHLRTEGDGNWDLLREREEYASVIGVASGEAGRKRFGRWLEKVQEGCPLDKTRPHETRSAAAEHLEQSRQTIAKRKASDLPLTPAEAFWQKNGADGEGQIDLASRLNIILTDIDALRQDSYEPDERSPGGRLVKNGKQLASSVQLSIDFLGKATKLQREILDVVQQSSFIEGLLLILREELADQKELRQRILGRVRQLVSSAEREGG